MRLLIGCSGAIALGAFVIGLAASAFVRGATWADRVTMVAVPTTITFVAALLLFARDSARHSSTMRKVRTYLLARNDSTDEQFVSSRPCDDAPLLLETRKAISRFFDVPTVKVGRDVRLIHDLHVDNLEPSFQLYVVDSLVASRTLAPRSFGFTIAGLVSIDDLAGAIRKALDTSANTGYTDQVATQPEDLGPLQARFGASIVGRIFRWGLGSICLLLGILFSGVAIAGCFAVNPEWVLGALHGIVFLVGGIALLRGNKSATKTCVEIHQRGLVVRDGANVVSFNWGQVLTVTEKEAVTFDEVIREGIMHESRAFRLQLHSGQVVVLKSYIRGLAEIGATVKRETLVHLLPAYESELREVGSVEFGRIRLSRNGIEVGNASSLWSEVSAADRKRGWIRIHRLDTWKTWQKARLSGVPNAHVLLEIVARRVMLR